MAADSAQINHAAELRMANSHLLPLAARGPKPGTPRHNDRSVGIAGTPQRNEPSLAGRHRSVKSCQRVSCRAASTYSPARSRRRNRLALVTTDTELKAMASSARAGCMSPRTANGIMTTL